MMNWNHKNTLKDGEKRFQQRYLDFVVNSELKSFFKKRAQIINYLRKFLHERDFLEIETPILNAQAGGALAKPFLTRSDSLKQNLELRIAPELYLKQLIIGGFERVFEIGRVFRNEGIDSTHNPEFTSLEFYMAYADYQDLITLTEELFKGLARELFDGQEKIIIPNFDINHKTGEKITKVLELDFTKPFQRLDVMTELGLDPDDLGRMHILRPKLIQMLKPYLSQAENLNDKQLIDKLIENKIEYKSKEHPAFIMNHPLLLSPLAKSHA